MTVTSDPRTQIQPEVTLWYEDAQMRASWPAVAQANAYAVEVRDAANALVWSTQIAAADYAPPLVLGSSTFTPAVGHTYTVRVWVVGLPSDPDTVAVVSLAAPVVASAYHAPGVRLGWPAVQNATAYGLRVARASDGVQVLARDGLTGTYVDLGTADGLQLDVAYRATVRGTAANCYGPWSAAVQFTVPSASTILSDLRARLMSARQAVSTSSDSSASSSGSATSATSSTTTTSGGTASYTYPISSTTLPADGAGNPARVLGILNAAYGSSLAVTAALEPAMASTSDSLTLQGTSALLGAADTASLLVFTVSTGLELDAAWRAAPPEGWMMSDAYPEVLDSGFDYLPANDPAFYATSFAHADAAVYFTLQPGLQFQATVCVRPDLLPASGDTAETGVLTTPVGGAIDLDADGRPQFAWTGRDTLASLTVARLGQAPLAVTGGTVHLSSTRTDDADENDNVLTIAGTVSLGGSALACTVDLPTTATGPLQLAAVAPTASFATAGAALSAAGVQDVVDDYVPASLLDLAGVGMTAYGLSFDPEGSEPSDTSLTLGFGADTWALVPAQSLSLSGMGLALTLSRAQSYAAEPFATLGVEVSGAVTLGGTPYDVVAAVPPDGPWGLEITDDSGVPTLDTLAALCGMTAAQVKAVLPSSLVALGSLALSRAALSIDPFTQSLSGVAFTIAQTAPWPVCGGLLTVRDWTIDLSIDAAGSSWATTGTLGGSITLSAAGSSTTLDITMAIPIGEESTWTVSLAEGSTVTLPTVQQILALLGAGGAALPVGIATLGGLTVTYFTVSFDPAAVTLKHVAFACSQASDWVILTSALSVSGVAASFAFVPGASGAPAAARGSVLGTVKVAGVPLMASMSKHGFSGDWVLGAGYADRVDDTKWTSLDAWMSPSTADAWLPATLPDAHGFDFGWVTLTFDGVTGALKAFGFSAAMNDVWGVLEGRLALGSVTAELAMPYPVTAAGITGDVAAVVTLAGVDIAVAANKPAGDQGSQRVAWQFTGTLLEGFTVDIVGALNDVAQTASFALPADIGSYGGFPAKIGILEASVSAVPDTGEFHFAGAADFPDWSFQFARAQFAVTGLRGSVDVAGSTAPTVGTLAGSFLFAGLKTNLALQLGTSGVDTVLGGTVAAADAPSIQIPSLANQTAANTTAEQWANVVPADLSALAFAGAAAYLNLTDSQFLVYGGLTYGGTHAASATLYVAKDAALTSSTATAAAWNYSVALKLASDFRFAHLFPALAVIDPYLRVTDARAVVCNIQDQTLGQLAQAVTTLLASVDPAAVSPLAGLSGDALALKWGVLLSATLDFATPTMFDNLLQIGTSGGMASVRLAALIDKASSANTVFTADLPDITILSTVLFTHTDAYPGIHLSYRAGDAAKYTLDGRVKVRQIFGGDFVFDVATTLDDAKLLTTLKQTSQLVAQPFGMTGITVSGLALAMTYTFGQPAQGGQPATQTTSQLTLQGGVAFGSGSTALSFTGKLALVSGVPALVYVAIDRDFSIPRFLVQCVTGNGNVWPSSWIDLVFENGSRIYYYDAAADPGGTVAAYDGYAFTGGYRIDAAIRLTLLVEMRFRGYVQVVADTTGAWTRVTAGIALVDTIDLVFVQLAGTARQNGTGPYIGGPELSFKTGDGGYFGLNTGISFLHTAFLSVQVQVTKGTGNETRFRGTLEAASALEPFGVLECTFVYQVGDPDPFWIEGWPDFNWLRDIIDFVEAIRDLCDTSWTSLCGQMADMADENAYDSEFSLSPAVTASGTNLLFSLTGTYALTVSGADEPFLEMTFPPLTVSIPATTTYAGLPDALGAGIAAGAETFASELLDDPEAISMFLVMLFGDRARSIALELICNALTDAAVASAAEAGWAAVQALGGVLAAGAVAAAADAIADALEDAEDNDDDGGTPTTPGVPRMRTLAYASGAFTGTWDAAGYAAGYTFQVLKPDGSSLGSVNAGYALTASVAAASSSLAAGTYTGRVKSTRGEASSAWSSLTLVRPAAPAVTLGWQNGVLSAGWSDVQADGYQVRILAPGGAELLSQTVAATVRAASVALPEPVDGDYTAQVFANKTNGIPSAAGTATLDVVSFAAPASVAGFYADAALTVSWPPAEGASYEVQVLSGTTTVDTSGAAPVYTMTGAAVFASAAAAGGSAQPPPPAGQAYQAGTIYQLKVRRVASGAVSPWTAGWITIVALPEPAGVTLRSEGGTLIAAWSAVTVPAYATDSHPTYSLKLMQVIDAADAVVGTASGVAGTTTQLPRTDGRAPAAGETYAVQVCALTSEARGAWSGRTTLLMVDVPAPYAVYLSELPAAFTVAWNGATSAAPVTGGPWEVRVARSASPDVSAGAATGVTQAPSLVTLSGGQAPAFGESFVAAVRAWAGSCASAWAWSPAYLAGLDAQVTAVSQADNYLRVTVQTSPAAVGGLCSASVYAPGTSPGVPPAIVISVVSTSAQTIVSVPMQWLGTGKTSSVAARVAAQGVTGAWSPPVDVWLLAAPANVQAWYASPSVGARWDAVAGATGYRVILRNSTGTTVSSTDWSTPPESAALIDVSSLPHGTYYGVTVQALAATGSAPAPAIQVVVLDAPQNVHGTYDGERVLASWDAVVGATSYNVRLKDASGAVAAAMDGVSASSVSLYADAGFDGVYQLTVQSCCVWPGPVSAPAPVLANHPPADVAATYAEPKVNVSWSAVAYADACQLILLDPAGETAAALEFSGSPPATSAVIDMTGKARGAYTVQLRTRVGQALSEPTEQTVNVMGVPADVVAEWSGAYIKVRWQGPEGATEWAALLLTAAGGGMAVVSVTEPAYGFSSTEFKTAGDYQVRVCATAPCSGAWCEPVLVTVPAGG